MTQFVRLGHGLYRPAEQIETLSDRCAAYLDVLPPGSVVGGLAAARLHGFWLPEESPTERIELILTRPEAKAHELARCRRSQIRARRRELSRDEIIVTERFEVTSAARTWVDLAEILSVEDLVAAGDSALRGLLTKDELVDAIARARHRRGVLRAREALTLLDARSRSRPESHLRCGLVRNGLPWPEVNVAIHTDDGEWLAEPDLHYRRARLALEYNGKGHADVDRMRNDISREIDVDSNDWKMVVFGPRQVFGHPYRIHPYVRGLLNRRDPGWWRRAG